MTDRGSASWPFAHDIFEIIALLARRDYAALERLSGGVQLSADELREVIEEYGCRLTIPPRESRSLWNVVAVTAADTPTWSVWLPLWTVEEGRSDLTLQLTVREERGRSYSIEIDGVHVL